MKFMRPLVMLLMLVTAFVPPLAAACATACALDKADIKADMTGMQDMPGCHHADPSPANDSSSSKHSPNMNAMCHLAASPTALTTQPMVAPQPARTELAAISLVVFPSAEIPPPYKPPRI